jgi:hypothetical protein
MTLSNPPVLYEITCGAGPAGQVTRRDQRRTRSRMGPLSHRYTGRRGHPRFAGSGGTNRAPVRSEYRKPGSTANGRSLPKADAIIVAPATYNTINKWANGISDNYAPGILAEAIGLRTPVVVLPFVNSALAAHPAFQRSLTLLREAGIVVIHGLGLLEPHPPGTGGSRFDTFPWHQALNEAETQRHLRNQPEGQRQDSPQSAL